jgi:hypothetical protein
VSSLAKWSYTAQATIWKPLGNNEYGDSLGWSEPLVIACDYGGDATARLGDIGIEINIKNTFWSEYSAAEKGDYILLGNSEVANPVEAGADEIMHVIRYADTFERIADDFAIITGI